MFPVTEWSLTECLLYMAKAKVPTNIFVWISNVFFTKWGPSVQISNGWAFRSQIRFEIQTICNPTYFYQLKSRLVWISDPQCSGHHLNTKPFHNWTTFDNLNSEHIPYSDPHCTYCKIISHFILFYWVLFRHN